MTMLGMHTDMQYHYIPSYFSTRDVNLNASCIVWPSSTSADAVLMNGHYHNGNSTPPFQDPFLAYKDKFKHVILQHEAIFKSQVLELHRLYNKQREFMDEMKRIEFCGQYLQLENSTSDQIFAEASFEYKQKASIASALPWPNPAYDQSFIPFAENKQSHTAYVQGNMMLSGSSNVQTELNSNECELLESNCIRIGKKILDLELPAYEYIDSDTEESLAVEMNPIDLSISPLKSFVENVKCFADLNEPIKLEGEKIDEYIDFLHPISGHEEIQHQDPPGKRNSQLQLEAQVTQMNKSEDPHECLPDTDDIEQGPEKSTSLLSKRKYHSDSSLVSSLRKNLRDLERIPLIVQALPCSKSCALLKGNSKRRSAPEEGGDLKHIKGIDLNTISPCYSMPDSEEQPNMIDIVSEKKFQNSKFHVDLNLCIDENESSALTSTELELHPPESPENKEQSPHRGDSDENEFDIHEKLEEDLVTTAAEAIVSISLSQVQKGDSLYWFAKLASSVVDDPESKFGMVLSSKNQDHNDGTDYFEAMTLQLEEYCCQDTTIQVKAQCPSSLPRRGRTRRGRQQKNNFQSEILPSLASLSRYEVNEDLQTIGGLIEAAQTSRKRAGRNGLTRGRRGRLSLSSKEDTPLCMQLNKQSGHGECSVKERNLLDWGKITRRPRRQRCPANNPRLILGQV